MRALYQDEMSDLRCFLQQAQAHLSYLPGGPHADEIGGIVMTHEDAAEAARADMADAMERLDVIECGDPNAE